MDFNLPNVNEMLDTIKEEIEKMLTPLKSFYDAKILNRNAITSIMYNIHQRLNDTVVKEFPGVRALNFHNDNIGNVAENHSDVYSTNSGQSILNCEKLVVTTLSQLKDIYDLGLCSVIDMKETIENFHQRISDILDELVAEHFPIENVGIKRESVVIDISLDEENDVVSLTNATEVIKTYSSASSDVDVPDEHPNILPAVTNSNIFPMNSSTNDTHRLNGELNVSRDDESSDEEAENSDFVTQSNQIINNSSSKTAVPTTGIHIGTGDEPSSNSTTSVTFDTEIANESTNTDYESDGDISKESDDGDEAEGNLYGFDVPTSVDQEKINDNTNIEPDTKSKRKSNFGAKQRELHSKASASRKLSRKHVKNSKETGFKCNVCHKRFRHTKILVHHRKFHLEMFPIHCRICLLNFSTKDEKTDHEKTCKFERYECCFCHYIGRNFQEHKIHMRTHTGKKPFPCSLCEKRFSQKGSMKRHEKNFCKKSNLN